MGSIFFGLTCPERSAGPRGKRLSARASGPAASRARLRAAARLHPRFFFDRDSRPGLWARCSIRAYRIGARPKVCWELSADLSCTTLHLLLAVPAAASCSIACNSKTAGASSELQLEMWKLVWEILNMEIWKNIPFPFPTHPPKHLVVIANDHDDANHAGPFLPRAHSLTNNRR
ncbi:hypothetical protein B0J18DRAFT_253185 [Chaetomium sp. MPI-SDFR-AT-0129]|nr:hypothetical protein B0J18DRAFT_253185 [Chaetomium sp. MPI-SDFR-AT-0129]